MSASLEKLMVDEEEIPELTEDEINEMSSISIPAFYGIEVDITKQPTDH